jgi:hypothetical protein
MARVCKLTDQQKEYVVRRLAAYDSPTAIARDLKREFGVTIGHQSVGRYNPELGSRLDQRWKDLFAHVRAAHLAATAGIGVTGKAADIRARERLAHAAWDAGRFKDASDILDAIAKDIGDPFNDERNSHEHSDNAAAPAPARIRLHRGPQPDPAPKAVGRVRQPRD